ncbi:MAG: right-handed parallel beta-helix repeat-containing protein, partial [Planctomycetota bacterium]
MKKLYFLSAISLFLAIPCAAQVIIVDANGTGDYPTIQAAIDDSNDGDTIIVEVGIYTGVGNKNIDFKGKAITVRSTVPEDPCVVASTIVDCQGAGRGFYFHSGEEANSVLNGLKITNGYVSSSTPGGNAGAGIYCANESGPTIANCHISSNTAVGVDSFPPLHGRGGGLYGCNGTITNCIISGNTALGHPLGGGSGGGLYGCNGTITNCTISGNTVEGGSPPNCQGGGLSKCDGTITNCTIIGNTCVGGFGGGLNRCNGTIINCSISGNTAAIGGGLHFCNEMITNCIISGNTASEGMYGSAGGGLCVCHGTITNCIINGNIAKGSGCPTCDSRGGGLYMCNGTITNCTISGNSAYTDEYVSSRGGGLYGCEGYIKYCIIWSNSALEDPELYLSSYPNYSCVKDWISGGIGNIVDDPMFVDPNNDNYRLLPDSPCIDTGDPGYVAEPNEKDLDGRARLVDGDCNSTEVVDMGAYEFSYAYLGDFDGECDVDFVDYAIIGLAWS